MSRAKWIVVAVVVGSGIAVSLAMFGAAREVVDVVAVEAGELSIYVEEQAKTRLPSVYRVTMPLSGRVLPITLIEGDTVQKGQIVARLDPADLKTAVEEGRARVAQLEKQIVQNNDTRLEDNALKQFDKFLLSINDTVRSAAEQTIASKAKVEFAESEFRRQADLKRRDATTEREFAEAELLLKQSRVDYAKDMLTHSSTESIRSAMVIGRETIQKYIEKKSLERDVLEEELAQAKLRLEQLLRDLSLSEIRSKMDGVVLRRHVSNLRSLSAGEVLLEIGRLSELEVEAEVLSEEAASMDSGMPVEIAGPAIGEPPLNGRIARIEPQAFTKVSSLGVEQQRVRVIIAFEPGELETLIARGKDLGAEYRVRVRIITQQRSHTISIPRSALIRSETGQHQVFVIREGHARRADVKTGLKNDFEIEILDGVGPGDQVVVAPESDLADGQRVEAREISP